jgi:A-macroglobulin TED domain/Alpha-2-macroglobulin family/MG2 domain/Carboxypeptidase regulatory-like domain/A-macroglobulin receptor binding domain/Alpha-2-macroglobulin bait region domain
MKTRSSFRSLILLVALLLSPLVAGLRAQPAQSPQPAQTIVATWTHNRLALEIPHDSLHAGSGTLTAELLDPEDKVLARDEQDNTAANNEGAGSTGAWRLNLAPAAPLAFDDLVWERLRIRFTFAGESTPAFDQTRSVSEVLRRPVVHILGQSSYLAGSQAAIRILVADANNRPIAGQSSLRIELLAANQPTQTLFAGRINHRGAVDAQFRFPAALTGDAQLHFIAETPIGSAEFTQPIRLEDKVSILLTTEKPLYQPGQTIHIRALALNRADRHASAGPLTFEIEDSRGNKVFRKNTATDAFGIASAEFTLADEVNLGAYHLHALIGDPQAPSNSAEIAFNVDRYVLPKFKVSIDFVSVNGKPKRDYRPGDHVTGTLHANYFFGEPVANAQVTLKASAMDVTLNQAASATGTTGKDGTWHFDLELPNYFAGRPLANGAAPVLLEATVEDSSGHAETRGEPVTVSQSSLLVTAVPEGGTLIPGLENRVYLLASYPDGSPAQATLTVRLAKPVDRIPLLGEKPVQPWKVETDASGVAVVHFIADAEADTLSVDAADAAGDRASAEIPLQSRNGIDQILLRAGRSVLKVGDRLDLTVLSTTSTGSAYIDLVKDGQTILTRDVDLVNGQATLAIDATPEMAGTLDIHAYRFGADAQAIGDHRIVFVEPAEDLHIETTADAAEYRPGAEAQVHFRVTDDHGNAVPTALGLQVVDEAVFALAEKQPGFAKVFFYLEQELMTPRYEIHSLSMDSVVEPADSDGGGAIANDRDHDRDAGALFSAMEISSPNAVDTEFGRELPQTQAGEFRSRYQQAFTAQATQIAAKINQLNTPAEGGKSLLDLFKELEGSDASMAVDAWGTPLRLEPQSWAPRSYLYFRVTSAGPDRRFDTDDDLTVLLEARTGMVVGSRSQQAIKIEIAHDRGPMNGLAQVSGTVTDQTGAVIPRATVTLSNTRTHEQRRATSDDFGVFNFAALPGGSYAIQISARGFETSVGRLSLAPRDLASTAAVLIVGSAAQTVTVTSAAAPIEADSVALATPMPMPAPPIMMGAIGGLAQFEQRAVAGQFDRLTLADRAEAKKTEGDEAGSAGPSDSAAPTHVRSYFPEALYINPEILTDALGEATVTIPIADSITTWRMAMLASTQNGALGSSTSSLKVFQDFFADLDLPVTLTQGDQVTLPVAVYNYAGAPGDVELTLQPSSDSGNWYTLVEDTATKNLHVDAGQVGGARFTLQANRIGKFKLTLTAHMHGAAERDDIVVREIEVVPNGREQDQVFNGRIDATENGDAQKGDAQNGDTQNGTGSNPQTDQSVQFPAQAIPDASKILVRLYPGPLSQVVEGMDALLRMPFGCFEQTSSSTYPNVLALDYMKRTQKLTPEIHAKAEGYIATGYQRLLTFEVPGGGFSWFGQAPANKILTAYGLMEFNDMAKVHDVDPALIDRTRQWLIDQQQPDGSWKPDTEFINEGATNRYNSDTERITAYIAWSLEDTGYRGPALDHAAQFLSAHLNAKADAYTLAVLANFAVEQDKDSDFTHQVLQALLEERKEGARQEKDNQVWWTADETGVYSTGTSAAIETTGLAVQALLKAHQSPDIARKALAYIAAQKDSDGTWGTTQATIVALRALLMASEEGSSNVRGTVQITLNGSVAEKLELTAENNDLFHQFVLTGVDEQKPNDVEIRFTGSGTLAWQVVGRSFVPWDAKPAREPLSIDVAYDRTTLAENDVVTATATVRNNLRQTANMVMVDLGIPPGFDLLSEDLQDFQEKTAGQSAGSLQKFNLTATQAILYFNALAPGSQLELHFRLRAKYPIRAKTFASRVYEYYDPAVSATARPVQLVVK